MSIYASQVKVEWPDSHSQLQYKLIQGFRDRCVCVCVCICLITCLMRLISANKRRRYRSNRVNRNKKRRQARCNLMLDRAQTTSRLCSTNIWDFPKWGGFNVKWYTATEHLIHLPPNLRGSDAGRPGQEVTDEDRWVTDDFGLLTDEEVTSKDHVGCLTWRWHTVEGGLIHYSDVILSAMETQITSVSIIYVRICSGADQRKHQSFASLTFVGEFTGDRWIPHTKGQ